MSENKDYAKLALEALLTERKKIKNKEIISAFAIGFLVGVMIYGIVKNGIGFIYIAIPLILIIGIVRHAQKLKQELKQIQAAMKNKKNDILH